MQATDGSTVIQAGEDRSPERTRGSLGFVVALNLVPLVGVLQFGWQSFDLIFLYWLENLVIGLFTVMRMVVRPYQSPIALVFPLLLAPFFVVHYGGFCWGHGTFVVSLFGPDGMNGFDLWPAVLGVLSRDLMLLAVAALAMLQVLDWLRDMRRHGFGADSAVALMIHPYRRIVVLHLTILGAGFALSALHEPLLGLVILVAVKTASDAWHWRKDEMFEEVEELTPELLAELQEKYPTPKLTVNGQEKQFASFREMSESPEYRMVRTLMKMVGGGGHFKALQAYMELRVDQERVDQDRVEEGRRAQYS